MRMSPSPLRRKPLAESPPVGRTSAERSKEVRRKRVVGQCGSHLPTLSLVSRRGICHAVTSVTLVIQQGCHPHLESVNGDGREHTINKGISIHRKINNAGRTCYRRRGNQFVYRMN